MSKRMTFFASVLVAAVVTLAAAGSAQARWGLGWGPYLYYGWPNDTFSFDLPLLDVYAPAYYTAPEQCGWVRVRAVWDGQRIWRRVWRCR